MKDKRDYWQLITHISVLVLLFIFDMCSDSDIPFSLLFIGLTVVFRVFTFCFNFLLAKVVKKRWKIDRLKGRVSPIYKLEQEEWNSLYWVKKYTVQYTPLKLDWSVPFSSLFLEQEYVKEKKEYVVENFFDVEDLEIYYESRWAKDNLKYIKNTAEKTKKQHKIENLNKTFNENYK
jgi:hypothetical protein